MSKVYALFVGINDYQAPEVAKLKGCVEDIGAMEALFKERVGGSLELKTLRNGEATRAGIIDGFLTHLGRAREGDFALFYYAGHGSREWAPKEWELLEPSKMNQTLVPVDAMMVDAEGKDVYDIADKELAALIHEVARHGPEVVVIADSCHSSGNTRGAEDHPMGGVGRMTSQRKTYRTLDTYLPLAQELHADGKRPEPRHIAIAACQHFETAKEFPREPPPRRGAFSLAFEQTVKALGPSATYVDIVNAVTTKVRDNAAQLVKLYGVSNDGLTQLPSLSLVGGASGHDVFLGGRAGRADLTVDQDSDGWWLSGGAFDIPSPAGGNVTEVAIYAKGAFDDASAPPSPVATAVVVERKHDRSRLKVTTGELQDGTQYIGAITRLGGAPALHVMIEGKEGAGEAAQRVRDAIQGTSPFFEVVDRVGGAVPVVTLAVGKDSVQVKGTDGTLLEGLQFDLDDPGLRRLAASCIHLASWQRVRDLEPKGSKLNGKVRIDLVRPTEGEAIPRDDAAPIAAMDGTVSLSYTEGRRPEVQIRLRNDSAERLFVVLLDLTDSFQCAKLFADWIEAGKVAWVPFKDGFNWPMTIPKWRGPSAASTFDYFKVVAAIESSGPERWELPALLGARPREATRSAGDDEDEKPPVRTAEGPDAFWGTSILKIVTSR